MPLPLCFGLLFVCSLIVGAYAYRQGQKYYEFENIGKPIEIKDIFKAHSTKLFYCYGFTTLCCIKQHAGNFLCLARHSLTEKVYYFSFNKDPGKSFTLYAREIKPGYFETILSTNH